MKKRSLLLLFSITVISCGTFLKVSELKKNGRFKASNTAEILKSVPFDLDTHKALLVVNNHEFYLGMARNINYFDSVITLEEFEQEIINAGKQKEIGSLTNIEAFSNAYTKYKPFLFLANNIEEGDETYWQLVLINPVNNEELFANQMLYDFDNILKITDKNTYNPMYNGLIDYIESNSKTYNK